MYNISLNPINWIPHYKYIFIHFKTTWTCFNFLRAVCYSKIIKDINSLFTIHNIVKEDLAILAWKVFFYCAIVFVSIIVYLVSMTYDCTLICVNILRLRWYKKIIEAITIYLLHIWQLFLFIALIVPFLLC